MSSLGACCHWLKRREGVECVDMRVTERETRAAVLKAPPLCQCILNLLPPDISPVRQHFNQLFGHLSAVRGTQFFFFWKSS